MKIGLSYSRCVRDIVDGVVDIDDVLVLITRTDFDPHDDQQWRGIWIGPQLSPVINIATSYSASQNQEHVSSWFIDASREWRPIGHDRG